MTTAETEEKVKISMAAMGHASSGLVVVTLVNDLVRNIRKTSKDAPSASRQRGYSNPKPWPSK